MKTMKYTSGKLSAFLFMLTALIAGCEDGFLDTKVDTYTTQKQVDVNIGLIGNFGRAPYTYLYDVTNGFDAVDGNLFAVCSDEAVRRTIGNSVIFTQGLMSPYNNPDNVYYTCYEGIRSANYFLENFQDYKERLAYNRDTISDNARQYDKDVLNIAWFMSEAHVIRAYYYYELMKRYGGVPLVTKTLSIDDNTNIARADVSEIVNFIVSEVDQEKNKLQPNWNKYDKNEDGRLSKASALAIKLRALMLYASPLYNSNNDLGRWQKAASAANDIINLKQFSLDDDYANLFVADNTVKSSEVIWALRFGETNELEKLNYPINSPGGNNEITPTHNLVSDYEYKSTAYPDSIYTNRDPRLGYSIVTNNSNWNGRQIQIWEGGTDAYNKANVSQTGYYLKKFLNENLNLVDEDQKQRSWIIFRYGEILLDYAEAMNEAYGPDDNNGFSLTAREAVNMIRSRPGVEMPDVVAVNQSEMRDKIKHERRIELAFEGHRYWDLVRWKDAETALNTTITGVIPTMNLSDSTFTYTVIDIEDRVFQSPKMYIYPIPQSEISKSNGTLQQNPGW
jgi:hypothetical protein